MDYGKALPNPFVADKPKTRNKVLADHERAHSGKPGAKARHGADAIGRLKSPSPVKDSDND